MPGIGNWSEDEAEISYPLTAKKDEIGEFSDLFGLAEYLYIVLFAYLAAYGAGPLSVDRLLSRRLGMDSSS